ncbi:MAG: glycolate oxidase iron-sulfur subunit [Thermoleophilaceae bacterium]|nr:glycolate oxidase iron-sulfur subunit [Thermoleophilaceae bacterium]
MSAFDAVRPPESGTIADCVHCGFCLPTCPTYNLWGEEMDSPRGRIVLMKEGLENGSSLSPEMVTHIDRCLGCMACVTACPSGVRYDELIEDTRAQIERNADRAPYERLVKRAIFETFPHPARLRPMVPLLAAAKALGITRAARRRSGGLLDRIPGARNLLQLAPEPSLSAVTARLPEVTAARGPRRGRVAFLQGCVQRVFFHEVNEATVAVLAAEGFDVDAPADPRCCGALQLHAGYDDPARALARETIEAFESYDHVVVNAAGCGSAMKDYGHLLRDDPEWSERASAFTKKVRDASELLAEHEPVAPRGEVQMRVAYHDACHLAHAQGVRAQPRDLLRGIPGMEVVDPPEWEICCGSAGIYNLVQPGAAAELGRRKARNLLDTGVQAVVAANPGCAIQIAAHSERLGHRMPVLHPMELLHKSIEGGARADDGQRS